MIERPILYSTEMVRAYLDDKKTMTRRPITAKHNISKHHKKLPYAKAVGFVHSASPQHWIEQWPLDLRAIIPNSVATTMNGDVFKCPYGQIGDKLYCRETWATMAIFDELPPRSLVPNSPIWYADTYPDDPTNCGDDKGKTRPSIHMPRWASRFPQTITGIRAEIAQNITEEDAIAEGFNSVEEFLSYFISKYKRTDLWTWVISYPKYSEEPSRIDG